MPLGDPQRLAHGDGAYLIEPNRGEAIRQAVLSCDRPSILLITVPWGTASSGAIKAASIPTVRRASRSWRSASPGGARAPDGMDRVRSLLELLPALKRHAGDHAELQN